VAPVAAVSRDQGDVTIVSDNVTESRHPAAEVEAVAQH